jgi:type I restriction-modification system DNA methylase subunit
VAVPGVVEDKIAQFKAYIDTYRATDYKEASARVDFIDPFFKALGWDVSNEEGVAEAFRDVVHEARLSIGSGTKAPDYSFRLGGARRFFVEAKKPSVSIDTDRAPAYQLRRYGWSAGLSVSVLTDFEQLAIYDCTIEPRQTDGAMVARLLLIKFDDYGDRWDEIEALLGRTAVAAGSLERFREDLSGRSSGKEVDDVFLAQIERWRQLLAEDIARRNRTAVLNRADLSYVVQSTLDRIIFLRFCEDRGLEARGDLLDATKGDDAYDHLLRLFKRADQRYNSGLFHFSTERGRSSTPDTLTLNVLIGDEVLTSIIEDLYYPRSPFEFSVMGPDVLGRAYEQFLGSEITYTGAQVTIDQKPEVRKAGGVYYTPQFVVDYIVRSSVEPMLLGKSLPEVAKFTVVDPSCGSGSFLVATYQYLLDWHLDRYLDAPARSPLRRRMHRDESGEWRLNIDERKRILTTHIYGVDIDPQAVEVAKLSLLLKVIEGESQTALAVERLLPDLGGNIMCGNSLVDIDFHTDQTLPGVDPELDERLRPFDLAIGNPPYLSVDDVWGKGDPRLAYLKKYYPQVYNDKTDLLFYFFAKALDIVNSDVAFIVSRAFLEAFKADKLRGHLASEATVRELIDLRNAYVFKGVGITTAIVHLTKQPNAIGEALVRRLLPDELPIGADRTVFDDGSLFEAVAVKHEDFGTEPWAFAEPAIRTILDKIDSCGQPVGAILHIGQGMQTGLNSVFGKRSNDEIDAWGAPPSMAPTRARNSDIRRFAINDSGQRLLYVEEVGSFSRLPVGVQDHLERHRDELEARAAFKRGNCKWWRYTWPLHKEFRDRDKILVPYLAKENRFALDVQQRFLGLTDTTILYDNGQAEDLRYILGVLNSRILTLRFRFIGKLKSGAILEYFENSVSKLPIPRIKPTDQRHKDMVNLVQQRIDVEVDMLAPSSPSQQSILVTRAGALDAQIETIVQGLFNLDASDVLLIEKELQRGIHP